MSLPRPAAKTFQDLVVWRKAPEFVLAIYPFTADFPKPETHGLAQQLRRAAVSISRPTSLETGQGSLHEYGRRFDRRVPLLLDSRFSPRTSITHLTAIFVTATI